MIISYFHKNITAWSSTHGNREGGGEVTGLPRERGGVTPTHTGDPPPRGKRASNSGGPRPFKVKLRSLTQWWPQNKSTAHARVRWKRSLLRRLRSPILRHRSSCLHLTGLDYACAETVIGEILLRMLESPSQSTVSGHRSSRLHDWTGRWKHWKDTLDIIGILL